MRLPPRFTPLALSIAAMLACPALADTPPATPLAPMPAPAHAAPIDGTPTLRHAPVRLNTELLDLDAATVGDQWSLAIFDDLTLPALIGSIEQRDGMVSIMGDVLSDDGAVATGDFVATIVGDAISLAAWLDDGRVFEVRPGPNGSHMAMQLDSVAFPTCANGPEHDVHGQDHEPVDVAGSRAASGGACSDDGSVLDVLIVYTASARNAAGGTNGITALANSAVLSANNSYTNSNVPTRLNLAHVAQIDYSEAGFSTGLNRLRSRNDGFADEAHTLRDQYNADFVAMFSTDSGACGIGFLMRNLSPGFQASAFTVTRYSCAVGNLSFAHEIGHNMGCAHDRDNSSSGLYSYSFGHRWVSTDNNRQYRSVMSYSPGSRIPYFSNPDVDYRGTPTGIAASQSNSAYNAQTIANSAPTIAGFRLSGTAPEIVSSPESTAVDAGSVASFDIDVSGNDLTYQWLRNNVPLSDDGRLTGTDSSSISIADVQPSDAGSYTVAILNGCGGVISDPATLDVTVTCPPDLTGDGELNFFDVSAFIALYNDQDLAADLAAPFGSLNFFDVSAFIAAYNAGCP